MTDRRSDEEVTVESLLGYTQAVGLPYSEDRLVELVPKVARQKTDMMSLWEIDVDGYEMALAFSAVEHRP